MSTNSKYYKYFFGCTCSKCMENNGIYISDSNKIPTNKCPYCQKSVDTAFYKTMIGNEEVPDEPSDETEYKDNQNIYSNDSYSEEDIKEGAAQSTIGSLLKGLSIIMLILSIIGSIIICIKDNILIGVILFFSSILLILLIYGIGEICCKLTSIDSKL